MTKQAEGSFDAAQAIDIWKTIVGVQQHFNDIGWRIRSLAMAALTFTLGATFFGYLNADDVRFLKAGFNPSAFVPVLGLTIWALFWFADGIWYHRLLKGAQMAANPIEETLAANGIEAGLSTAITKESREGWWGFKNMNSTLKLNIFYGTGTGVLILVAVAVFVLTLDIPFVDPAVDPTATHTPSP